LSVPPWLVFGVGNPSRGDDALGPAFVERAPPAIVDGARARVTELSELVERLRERVFGGR